MKSGEEKEEEKEERQGMDRVNRRKRKTGDNGLTKGKEGIEKRRTEKGRKKEE
jgi:hypothetical protein